MKRRTPRRASPDRELRRHAILRAALRLFAERGMENVTYGDIAKAARLSRPLVYFYFPDLQTLSLEAQLLAVRSLQARFAAAVRPGDRGVDQIMAIGHAYVRFAHDEPHYFQLLAHKETQCAKDEPQHPLEVECDGLFAGIMGLLVAALQRGAQDGSIRRDLGDPTRVAICLWGLTHGLIQITTHQRPTIERRLGAPAPELPGFGLDLLRHALETPPPRKRT